MTNKHTESGETVQRNTQRIDDPSFLRTLSRFMHRPSRFLDGCPVYVEHTSANVKIVITNTLAVILEIAWVNHRAVLLPGSALLTAHDLLGRQDELTTSVRRFFRRHRLIDTRGRETWRRPA